MIDAFLNWLTDRLIRVGFALYLWFAGGPDRAWGAKD